MPLSNPVIDDYSFRAMRVEMLFNDTLIAIGNLSRFTLAPINLAVTVDLAVGEGDDVFVLGYPEGLTGGPEFPIWKTRHDRIWRTEAIDQIIGGGCRDRNL